MLRKRASIWNLFNSSTPSETLRDFLFFFCLALGRDGRQVAYRYCSVARDIQPLCWIGPDVSKSPCSIIRGVPLRSRRYRSLDALSAPRSATSSNYATPKPGSIIEADTSTETPASTAGDGEEPREPDQNDENAIQPITPVSHGPGLKVCPWRDIVTALSLSLSLSARVLMRTDPNIPEVSTQYLQVGRG